jgi:hypothetical protein
MPVSCLLGHGPPALVGWSGERAAIGPEQIDFIGIRSVDAEEKQAIRLLGLSVYDMRHIDEHGMRHTMTEVLADVDENTHLHVSFDLDCLDADNWYHPGHLSSLLQRFRQSAAPVCTSLRTFHLPDGTALPVSDPDENLLEHVDTSCYLIHRWAFGLTTLWSRMPRQVSPICDRIFYSAILKERYALASTRERSVAFRTLYTPHYMAAGLKPPPDAKPPELLEPSYAWLLSKAGVDECFHRLGFWPMTFMRNYPGGPGQKPLR